MKKFEDVINEYVNNVELSTCPIQNTDKDSLRYFLLNFISSEQFKEIKEAQDE